MARLPSAAPHTLWILFFSYTTNKVMAAGHVEEFACFTDYDKELVCHWKVPAQINCSKEFLLFYRRNVCVPENGKDGLRCTCTIYPGHFVSGLTYILALQFNGTDMWNYSVIPALVVKPRAPINLAIEKVENGNFNLSWEESYSPASMLSGQPVIYEVKYWRKQHPTEASVKAINYQTKNFEITASSLMRGYDYVASVRCNYTEYPAYWSEWSEEVEFHYDYQVTAEDILQMAVPISCILIMAVSVICYFCFTKVKKEWWDQIPNPAKSHLVVKNVKFSVLCYIDEIKFPFHDLKQNHMENQIICKNCLAQSLSSQNFNGKDNIRNVEKSCSCHSKSGEWFPKGGSAVLTPETILVEKCIEICECLTDIEPESHEETSDQITMFEPCESSFTAFREHTEHNDALASMFIELLADDTNVQDSKDPGIITGENKTFEKLESENPSQRNPEESAAQSQQSCDISHTVSLFTKASQDNYNCSTASKKSQQSEESFESGYRSSSINSASVDARDLQHMVHQSIFPCSSESQHDLLVLIQESPNKTSFGTKKGGISNPAHKNFDTLVSPSMGLCSSAYKSFDTLLSPAVEPCGSAYKSCDTLVSPAVEPCGSAYKSCDTLVSPAVEPCGSAYKSCDTLVSPAVEPCGSAYKSCDTLVSPAVEPCGSAYKSCDTLVSPAVEPCGSAYKSCDTLVSPAVEPCGSAYKSCDTLVSPAVEPCGSAYKSFDILVSACKEPSSSVYKSFDTFMSQSTTNSSLTLCFENVCSSPPLTRFSETLELSSRDQIYQPPSNQTCYAKYRSCTELDFQNTCSEHTDFPSFSTHVNDSTSAFLPEQEIYKQVTYQNVQKKAHIVSCPIGPQPSGYQPFDNAVKCNGTYCGNDSEVISRSLYEPFICLLYKNLRETPPDTIISEPDQRTDDHICLIVQGFDCSVVPALAPSENVSQTSDGRLWIINSNELPNDRKYDNTSRDEQLLQLLKLNCQDFNSRERTIKWTKPNSFNYTGKGMQESSNSRLNTDFHCHMHNYLRKLGNAGENKEVIKHVVGRRRCDSAASLPEASLDVIGLNLKRKPAEPVELLVSGKVSPPLFLDNSCPDSHAIQSEGSRLAPAVKKSPVELLRENNRKNEKKIKLVQALAQENNCYMKVA
ncbi:interleukin-4 receptor subunit alpha isoform X2 [Tyto alba]|uniref:interleukin-4 receptor subunit alpha isoform X2 n=1 Tax=Tyto alba TaxID=56313 RepID=UPI001C66C7E7|nr:interleukin-4 receptor subunit alpha isoform X2 [Tyto alba]